jgi:hypothetical protein
MYCEMLRDILGLFDETVWIIGIGCKYNNNHIIEANENHCGMNIYNFLRMHIHCLFCAETVTGFGR